MKLNFNADGLIPAVTQDYISGEVLMLGYMNEESYNLTLETGIVHYYSRSRQKLWKKGETSGHLQYVKRIMYDCYGNSLLISIIQVGEACHTLNRSCYYRAVEGEAIRGSFLNRLHEILETRDNPETGPCEDSLKKEIGDAIADLMNSLDYKDGLINKTADLIFQLTKLLNEKEIRWDYVLKELYERNKN